MPKKKNIRIQTTDFKKKPVKDILNENKYFVWGMFAVFFILVFFAVSYKVSGDDDFFWHLATGRFIVENKYVPDKDVFGFVTEGVEWIPFEWGWDVLSYGLYNIGGYNAILLFRSLMFVFIFYLYFRLMQKLKVNSIISIIVLFTLLVGIMDRFSPRPHILTYFFFILLITVTVSYRYLEREKYEKYLKFIPLIFLLWGNSHMGVLAGGLYLFIFTVSEILIYKYSHKFSKTEIKPLSKQQLKNLFLISVISAFVLLINPHGLQTYIYAYNHTKMKMLETINEWQNPFSTKMEFGFIVTLYKIFLFSGVLVLFYSWLKKDLTAALIWIGFTIYSVRAIRFTVDYEIVMAVYIAIALNYLVFRLLREKSKIRAVLFYNNFPKMFLSLFFIYTIALIPSNKIYQKIMYYRVSGWGIDEDFIPVQLINFMKEAGIKGKPFNHFGTGGNLVWTFPDQKNFIDSRNLNDEIMSEYRSILYMMPGFENKLKKYEIDYVLYLDPDLIRRPNELKTVIVSYCSKKTNEWKLVYWDDKSFLFLKNDPKYADIISKYEYKVINPYNALFNKTDFENMVKSNQQRAKEELERKQQTEPNGVLYNSIKGLESCLIQ